MEMNNPFRIKALVVYDGIDEENATASAFILKGLFISILE